MKSERVSGEFDLKTYLSFNNEEKAITEYRSGDIVFSQGDPADAVFYIQRGRIKLAVVSAGGKEAVVGILADGDFRGEGCLYRETVRTLTASALMKCRIIRLEKASHDSSPPRRAEIL